MQLRHYTNSSINAEAHSYNAAKRKSISPNSNLNKRIEMNIIHLAKITMLSPVRINHAPATPAVELSKH